MSGKQNNDTIISVTEDVPNDPNNTSRNSSYKTYDKKKRNKVILWSYIAICFVAIALCVASFKVPVFQLARLKGLRMWQWCLLIAALLTGPLLSYLIVKFILLCIDRDFSIRENVIYYVVGLGKSAAVVLWFSMILVAWLWVVEAPSYLGVAVQGHIVNIKKKYGMTYHIITVTQITLILGSFLWLLKDLVMMKAKSEFHIRRFFDRIKQALFHQYIIEVLSRNALPTRNEPRQLMFHTKPGKKGVFAREAKRLVNLLSFENVSEENVSCWGMKILIEDIIGNQNLRYYKTSESIGEIDTKDAAIRAAETIYKSLEALDEINHIGENEILMYFRNTETSEVLECLREGAHSKEVEIEVFRKWMLKVYRYRKALVRALEANKSLFKKFNRFVNVLLIFLIFALWLIMIRVETRRVIFLIATAIVGSAFIFGDTSKKVLENLLFVFLVHPFDVGDCCLIDNTPVIIEDINILSTTVLTFENEMKHYPNIVLAGQSISNYTRSPHMGDFVTLSLNLDTPRDEIDEIKTGIKRYIESNPQYWCKDHHWEMDLGDMTSIKLTLRVQHTINYHELNVRQIRKSELVLELKDALYKYSLTRHNNPPSDRIINIK